MSIIMSAQIFYVCQRSIFSNTKQTEHYNKHNWLGLDEPILQHFQSKMQKPFITIKSDTLNFMTLK